MYHQDLMAFPSSLGRSRDKDRRTIKSTSEHVTYKKVVFFPKWFLYVRFFIFHLLILASFNSLSFERIYLHCGCKWGII
ncbi:unnamed protein product [Hymenolepis diminuta]|uniref:Uncharacterized protein n=1 Tax=Hymenolepis diminuta TaxID=6216 RepID=A0A564Z0G3_HYMDI|nr:unnamed protein product [Hymenolepis diminuta]